MEQVGNLLKKAQKYLQSAAVLLELEDFDSCASRSYFAMFYAAQAILRQSGYSTGSNHGIRSSFCALYVDSGRLPERAREAIERGAALQEIGDYGGEFLVSREEAEWVLQESEAFVNSIARLIHAQTAG